MAVANAPAYYGTVTIKAPGLAGKYYDIVKAL